jgi:hypothetical protein
MQWKLSPTDPEDEIGTGLRAALASRRMTLTERHHTQVACQRRSLEIPTDLVGNRLTEDKRTVVPCFLVVTHRIQDNEIFQGAEPEALWGLGEEQVLGDARGQAHSATRKLIGSHDEPNPQSGRGWSARPRTMLCLLGDLGRLGTSRRPGP